MTGLGGFDFRDMKKLQKQLKRMQREYPGFLEACIRELAARLLAKTVARTPVDTGELRRRWTIGAIQRIPNGYQVEVINPVEYSMYVEYGHRTRDHNGWVEGRFMLTISEREIQEEMPAFLERKLQKWINRNMGR